MRIACENRFWYFDSVVQLVIANLNRHVEVGRAFLTLRVMQGRRLPLRACIPESPEFKNTEFEIDTAGMENNIII